MGSKVTFEEAPPLVGEYAPATVPMVNMSIAIPADLRIWINKLAQHYGKTPSEMARIMLVDYHDLCGGKFGRFRSEVSKAREQAIVAARGADVFTPPPLPGGIPYQHAMAKVIVQPKVAKPVQELPTFADPDHDDYDGALAAKYKDGEIDFNGDIIQPDE
jgi:hypothetical protein